MNTKRGVRPAAGAGPRGRPAVCTVGMSRETTAHRAFARNRVSAAPLPPRRQPYPTEARP